MGVARSILSVIAVAGGFLAAVTVMPAIAIACLPLGKRYPSQQRHDVDSALKRLLRRGLVEEVRRGRTVGYELTSKGREYLTRRELATTRLVPPKRWDGKWRLVVFDIAEKQRHLRDCIRTHLGRLGLHPIQKSVWLYPHPCADLVRLLKVDLGLSRDVQCFTVKKFEDREEEKMWRRRFDV